MASYNDITGNCLVTKPATETYRSGWDAIFGNKKVDENVPENAPDAPGTTSDLHLEADALTLEAAVKAVLPEFLGGTPTPDTTNEEDEAWAAMAEKSRQEGFVKQSEVDALLTNDKK